MIRGEDLSTRNRRKRSGPLHLADNNRLARVRLVRNTRRYVLAVRVVGARDDSKNTEIWVLGRALERVR